MPPGRYATRESNSKWNPGLPDLSDKARANILRKQAEAKSATATSSGGDSEVASTRKGECSGVQLERPGNNVNSSDVGNKPELQRPKPRGIFSGSSKKKSIPPAASE